MKALYLLAAVSAALATTPANSAQHVPDYEMICFPIPQGSAVSTCLERSNGVETWYWYDHDGGWGVLD